MQLLLQLESEQLVSSAFNCGSLAKTTLEKRFANPSAAAVPVKLSP